MSDENIFDVTDYRGKRIIFTKKKLKEKSVTHPELLNIIFLKNLKQTIIDPEEVWPDYKERERIVCCYKKYSINTYVKAIIWICDNPCHVVSAFETSFIKESKYLELTRLK